MKRSIVSWRSGDLRMGGDMNQPRTLGNRAVLHVYYYAPRRSRLRTWIRTCSRTRLL